MAQEPTGFEETSIKTADGLLLYVRKYKPVITGSVGELPVICLPGLTRNSRDFHAFALRLASSARKARTVYTLDSRGRGNSEWDPDKSHYNLLVETADVVTACEQLGITKALFVGTSRGGLVMHLLAGMKAELIAGSVLNDIGPEVDLEGLRHIQSYLANSPAPHSIEDAKVRLKAIHEKAFPTLAEEDWHEMAEAIYAFKNGRLVADFDPAIAEAVRNLDLSQPGPTLWPQFVTLAQTPLMTIRGEYSTLLTTETLKAMHQHAPAMQSLIAYGQGHAPILHLADIFPHIEEFLEQYR